MRNFPLLVVVCCHLGLLVAATIEPVENGQDVEVEPSEYSYIGYDIFRRTKLQKGMKKLNDLLNNYVHSKDLDVNLYAIKGCVRNMDTEVRRRSLRLALKLVAELEYAKEPEHWCTFKSLDAIVRNKEAAGSLDRLSALIEEMDQRHQTSCVDKYPKIVRDLNWNLDESQLEAVDRIFNGYFMSELKEQWTSDPEYHFFVLNKQSRLSWPEYLFDVLKQQASKEELEAANNQANGAIELGKIKELVDKYLVGPCQYYSREVKPYIEVFKPFLTKELMFDIDPDPIFEEYYKSFFHYNACDRLVKKAESDNLASVIQMWMTDHQKSVKLYTLLQIEQ